MTGHPGGSRLIAPLLLLAGGGAAGVAVMLPASAPAAAAATIRLSQGCYQTAQKASLQGHGFDPAAHWSARLDGAKFGSGTTTSAGDISATFGVPSRLRKGSTGEDSYKLVVRERKRSATATFLVTHLAASFSPASGPLATLKVRFQLLGWGRGGSVYLHYVSPSGLSRLDRTLGHTAGACGHLSTSPIKLFPFTPKTGNWTLQFDKSSTYKASSVPRVAIRYKVA